MPHKPKRQRREEKPMVITTITIHEFAALIGLVFALWIVRSPRRPFRDARAPSDWKAVAAGQLTPDRKCVGK
jgi:hypothetical protein